MPIGREDSDVDHILVGPNGVFVLNTKHHVGASIWVGDFRLMINRSKTDHLRNAASENRKVAQRLTSKVGFPVTVRSAIVVVGERSIKDIRQSDARPVAVLSSLHVARWLTSQPATASATQLDLIRLAAEEPETWHIDPHRADNLRVMHRFARLQDAVGSTPPRPLELTRESDLSPVETAPSKVRPSRGTAPRPRSGSQRMSSRSRRSDRQSKKLAEGIMAVGFLVVMVTTINNGTWMPFVTGIFSALSPSP